MIRDHRNAVVLTLVVCALSSRTVLAKQHHSSHKPSIKASAGTLSLATNSYQGSTTLSAGVVLLAPPSYEGLIINSGDQDLIANSAGTLTLANSYLGSVTVSTGTLTIGNSVNLASSATMVSNSAQIFPGSIGTQFLELSNSSSSMGTLQVNNTGNYSGAINLLSLQQSAGSITLNTSSNVLIPSNVIVLSSGTLTVTAPEPTSLGLVTITALALLRRPSRK